MSFSKAVSKQNPVFDLHFALVEDSTIATWRHDGTVFASLISSIPLHHPLPSYHLIAFVAEAIVRDDIMFHEKHQLLAYSCKHQHKSSNWNWRPLDKRPPLLTAHDIVALKIFLYIIHKRSCSINWWNWLCTMCAIELIDLKRIKDKNSKYLLTYFKHYYSNNTNHICYESQRFPKKHKLLYRVVFLTGPPQKMTKCQFTY